MEFYNSIELVVPLSHIVLLLILSTVALVFGKIRIALLFNYCFVFIQYWGYFWEYILNTNFDKLDPFLFIYGGFGVIMVILALLGFLSHTEV